MPKAEDGMEAQGGAPQGGQPQGDPMQQVMQMAQQMAQEGADPMQIVQALMEQGVPPEAIGQVLVQLGMPEEQVQQVMQEIMQGQPQGEPQQEGQPMMEGGGETHRMPDGTIMPGKSHGIKRMADGGQAEQPQGGGDQMQQVMQMAQQMAQEGAEPAQIVQALMEQGVPPEAVAQVLVQLGVPEEQVQQVMQQVMQGAPQEGAPQGQPMMAEGGDYYDYEENESYENPVDTGGKIFNEDNFVKTKKKRNGRTVQREISENRFNRIQNRYDRRNGDEENDDYTTVNQGGNKSVSGISTRPIMGSTGGFSSDNPGIFNGGVPSFMAEGGEQNQMMQQVAQALQEGMQQSIESGMEQDKALEKVAGGIMSQLMESGMTKEDAQSLIQDVMKQMQGGGQGQPQGISGEQMMAKMGGTKKDFAKLKRDNIKMARKGGMITDVFSEGAKDVKSLTNGITNNLLKTMQTGMVVNRLKNSKLSNSFDKIDNEIPQAYNGVETNNISRDSGGCFGSNCFGESENNNGWYDGHNAQGNRNRRGNSFAGQWASMNPFFNMVDPRSFQGKGENIGQTFQQMISGFDPKTTDISINPIYKQKLFGRGDKRHTDRNIIAYDMNTSRRNQGAPGVNQSNNQVAPGASLEDTLKKYNVTMEQYNNEPSIAKYIQDEINEGSDARKAQYDQNNPQGNRTPQFNMNEGALNSALNLNQGPNSSLTRSQARRREMDIGSNDGKISNQERFAYMKGKVTDRVDQFRNERPGRIADRKQRRSDRRFGDDYIEYADGGQHIGTPYRWDGVENKFIPFAKKGMVFNKIGEGLENVGYKASDFLDIMNYYENQNDTENRFEPWNVSPVGPSEKGVYNQWGEFGVDQRGADVLSGTGSDWGSFNQTPQRNFKNSFITGAYSKGGLTRASKGMQTGSEHYLTKAQEGMLVKAGYKIKRLY